MNLKEIDWNALLQEKRQRCRERNPTSGAERWDTMAPFFNRWMENDDYPSKLLRLLKIKHDWSVLDIGCGTGAVSIGAAIRAGSVTALDISANMLEILKKEAETRRFWNIRTIQQSWESIRINLDIYQHDVVIASRSLSRTGDLRESLLKMDQVARRYVYVTAWGGDERGFNQEFKKNIGRSCTEIQEYVYVFNLLHCMGIHPNVEQMRCRSRGIYTDPDDALLNYQVLYDLSPEERGRAEIFLQNHLSRRDDGRYETAETETLWSLIWWKKPSFEKGLDYADKPIRE